jgi:hypothetical protein
MTAVFRVTGPRMFQDLNVSSTVAVAIFKVNLCGLADSVIAAGSGQHSHCWSQITRDS